jgi:hypothetical protein
MTYHPYPFLIQLNRQYQVKNTIVKFKATIYKTFTSNFIYSISLMSKYFFQRFATEHLESINCSSLSVTYDVKNKIKLHYKSLLIF